MQRVGAAGRSDENVRGHRKAEKALSIAQSQEYIEKEKKPKQQENEKIDLLRDKLHRGNLIRAIALSYHNV